MSDSSATGTGRHGKPGRDGFASALPKTGRGSDRTNVRRMTQAEGQARRARKGSRGTYGTPKLPVEESHDSGQPTATSSKRTPWRVTDTVGSTWACSADAKESSMARSARDDGPTRR